MPDHKEMGRKPTDRERETAFAPHQSPDQQADGDPGDELPPRLEQDDKSSGSAKQSDDVGKQEKTK